MNQVPFFRPAISEVEIEEVVATLRSGWLTTGPRTRKFEQCFAKRVGAPHAVAVNSCTAAMHLALEALEVKPGDRVLVPTMTFAATAEVVRYLGAEPVLVDCEPDTLAMRLEALEETVTELASGRAVPGFAAGAAPVGIIPVHVAGLMLDIGAVADIAARHDAWVVEDAAHSFPAAWRPSADRPWQPCGGGDSAATCFSFYANKTITTGEGGMAVTGQPAIAERMRVMSLHGISKDAWNRYDSAGSWYYEIVAPGFKYNLTDIAAALGLHQLARAAELQRQRAEIAEFYDQAFLDCGPVEAPPRDVNRQHSWHLYYLRLDLDRLSIDRGQFIEELKRLGIGCSVHWMPLHLHPYYRERYGYEPEHFPTASAVWQRLVSLPIFPGMSRTEQERVVDAVLTLCERFGQ